MVILNVPLTLDQIMDLVRRLPSDERRKLLDALSAERFDAVLADADIRREGSLPLTDEEIQKEVDAVRDHRRQDRQRAAGR